VVKATGSLEEGFDQIKVIHHPQVFLKPYLFLKIKPSLLSFPPHLKEIKNVDFSAHDAFLE
jgi:hypothetical protein